MRQTTETLRISILESFRKNIKNGFNLQKTAPKNNVIASNTNENDSLSIFCFKYVIKNISSSENIQLIMSNS